jgi:transcriptional regulator with XRE-family HTH domain
LSQKLGEKQKVPRNLIHEYLSGKRAPTYEAAAAISQALDLGKRKFLILTYFTRQEQRRRSERERFLEFCRKEGIPVFARELDDWDK